MLGCVTRRKIETQLEQFAVNARSSPGRILGNHLKDQGANLFADTLAPSCSWDPEQLVQGS